jgi:uncharacterized protein
MSSNDFADRYGPVALVTGASSGIGKAFAAELAAKGLDLVLVARRLGRLEELAAQLAERHGVKAQPHQIDLAQPTAAQQMLDATSSLDVGLIVSNAGFGMVNCNVPMQLSRGFIPRLRERGKGGIIFTSSVEGLMGCPYSTAYSSSKALVNALGEGLWAELHPEGIDVLTLCPGATESEAASKQGIDIATLRNVMPAEEVARLTLANIQNGPLFFSSEYYRANFEKLLSLPRRDALMAMARGMKR